MVVSDNDNTISVLFPELIEDQFLNLIELVIFPFKREGIGIVEKTLPQTHPRQKYGSAPRFF